MAEYAYGVTDFQNIAAGAVILASGGGGSYYDAAPQLIDAAGVVSSFAGLLRNIGYAGTMPY